MGRRSERKQRAPERLAEANRLFFVLEKFYDSLCLHKLIGLALERNFPKRLLDMAVQAHLSKRILRAGAMVVQSNQPTNGTLAGCSLGIRFARVVLYNILKCSNNTLPEQLPAPVETRQFVDDLTAMSVANSEADVTHSICFVALELRDELGNGKLTLSHDCQQPQMLGEERAKNP